MKNLFLRSRVVIAVHARTEGAARRQDSS
jgi:hypothetical protein